MGILEMLARLLGLHRLGLQHQYAGYDGETVRDPVLHLLQQQLLLPHQLLHLLLHRALCGDVGHAEQDGGVRISLIEHFAGAKADRAPPEAGKLAVDLIGFDDAVLGKHLFQERLELRDVPLAFAQVVQEPPLGVLTIDLELEVKGPARRYDAELAVEHDQRLIDGIHDGLRQSAHVLNSEEGLNVGHSFSSSDLTPPRDAPLSTLDAFVRHV